MKIASSFELWNWAVKKLKCLIENAKKHDGKHSSFSLRNVNENMVKRYDKKWHGVVGMM